MRWLLWWAALIILAGSLRAETIKISDFNFKAQSPPGDWQYNMNCGPTAALMVAANYQSFIPTTEKLKALIDWLYTKGIIYPQSYAEYYDGNVTSTWQLKKILEDYFQVGEVERRIGSDLEYLRLQLLRQNPIIVGVNINMSPAQLGHFMVVVGLNDSQIIVHDPGKTNGAYNSYSLEKFLASWATSGYSSLAVQSNGAVWYPNGSLLQVVGSNMVYLVKDQKLYWVKNEAVFNTHHFDWKKIISVQPRLLDCLEYGGEIDNKPYREVYEWQGTYYLYEKSAFIALTCTLSSFSSSSAFSSWRLPLSVQKINSIDGLYGSCKHGTTLYFRDGSLIKPENTDSYGAGVIFVATNNGELRAFADWETFQIMGYDNLEVLHVTEQAFYSGARFFGSVITEQEAMFCGNAEYQIQVREKPETVDDDDDGYDESQGDCDDQNPFIYPGAVEVCDSLDNDCNGEEDDGLIEECFSSCGKGWHYCHDGYWNGCEIYEFVPEIEDGFDNDCDGLIDEGFVIPEDADPRDQDNDHDGFTSNQGDCDDWSPEINPGHPEICDYLDNNCNLLIDEGDVCNEDSDIVCNFRCPTNMTAHVWYGSFGWQSGNPLQLQIGQAELCLRGQPWLDFNCVCPDWVCHDWTQAEIECNQSTEIKVGEIDFAGEGEVWFFELSCQ